MAKYTPLDGTSAGLREPGNDLPLEVLVEGVAPGLLEGGLCPFAQGELERGAGKEIGFAGGVEEDGEGGVGGPAPAVSPLQPGGAVDRDVAEGRARACLLDEDRGYGPALAPESPDSGVGPAHGMPHRHCAAGACRIQPPWLLGRAPGAPSVLGVTSG